MIYHKIKSDDDKEERATDFLHDSLFNTDVICNDSTVCGAL